MSVVLRGPMRYSPYERMTPWTADEDRAILAVGERGELARVAAQLGRTCGAAEQRRRRLSVAAIQRKVRCPNGCGAMVHQRDIERHLRSECPKR